MKQYDIWVVFQKDLIDLMELPLLIVTELQDYIVAAIMY